MSLADTERLGLPQEPDVSGETISPTSYPESHAREENVDVAVTTVSGVVDHVLQENPVSAASLGYASPVELKDTIAKACTPDVVRRLEKGDSLRILREDLLRQVREIIITMNTCAEAVRRAFAVSVVPGMRTVSVNGRSVEFNGVTEHDPRLLSALSAVRVDFIENPALSRTAMPDVRALLKRLDDVLRGRRKDDPERT